MRLSRPIYRIAVNAIALSTLAVAALSTANSVASGKRPLLHGHPLTMQHLGDLRIGMTLSEMVRRGYGIKDEFPPANDPDSLACNQATLISDPGIAVLTENGKIVRIEVHAGETLSASGVGIGSTEAQVKEAYGDRLIVEPHQYDPTGRYLKVFSRDGKYGMVFETDGHAVTEFRAGLKNPVQYVEGCL